MAWLIWPSSVVADAEVAQGGALALPVADLAGDGQRLLVEVDGLGDLAERPVARAETVLAGGVGPRVIEVALQPLVHLGGEPVVTPLDQVVEVDAEQDLGRGVVVARPGSAARTRLSCGARSSRVFQSSRGVRVCSK